MGSLLGSVMCKAMEVKAMHAKTKDGAQQSSNLATGKPTLGRRDFVRRSALAAGALAASTWVDAWAGEAPKAKVVVVTTKAPLGPGASPPLELVEKMVETGITTLAGKSDPMQAWETFVRRTDTVCLPTAGGQLENVPEVNIAVYQALARLGVNKMTIGTHRMSSVWHTTVT